MTTKAYFLNPQEFNKNLVSELKKIQEIQAPEWSSYVKTSVAKTRPTTDPDFWYLRTAAILRQLAIKGVIGVNRLKTRFGAKKNRGGKPSRFKKASGKIIRTILQQLEQANLVEKVNAQQHGRRLTQHGREFISSIKIENKTPKKETQENPQKKSETKQEEKE